MAFKNNVVLPQTPHNNQKSKNQKHVSKAPLFIKSKQKQQLHKILFAN